MTRTIDAIYENGVLRPLAPIEGLAEREKVRVSIESPNGSRGLLEFCGTISDEDTREIEKVIEAEFEQVNPDDWK